MHNNSDLKKPKRIFKGIIGEHANVHSQLHPSRLLLGA